jgi:HupE / UreJ protein
VGRCKLCSWKLCSFALGLVLTLTAQAHVVSMSTGELQMDGPTAVFELRIPLYEVAQLDHPETVLMAQFRFGDGHLTRSSCHPEEGSYVCRAEYEFPGLHPDSLEVVCTLYQVTVPNHVHLLTATQGPNTDQEVFDQRFPSGLVRFHPPSRGERIARDAAAGATRAIESAAGILFILGLALAARGRREAVTFGAVFLAAEGAARPLGPLLPLAFSARALEAVLGLTVAYLAVEILLLPEGRARWTVVAVLGLCHGFSLAGLPAAYLIGALPGQAAALALLTAAALRMPLLWKRPAAGLLLGAGLAWFAARVWR